MKSFIKIVFLLISFTVCAQSSTHKLLKQNEWINNNLDYIRFEDGMLTYNLGGKKHTMEYDLAKRTLSLKENYLEGGTLHKEEKITLKIKHLSKDKLVVYPMMDQLTLDQESFKKLDYKPFYKTKQLTFYSRNNMMKRVDYKKITFHGSTCFGTCPSFTVEVNRDGTVFYQGRIYTKEFTGNFEGQLPMEERVKLIKILNRSQLALIDTKWEQNSHVTDQPRYNYIVELKNGKKIEINTNDQHPILDKLSDYLVAIPEKLELKKAKEKHVYEQASVKGYEIVYRDDDE